MTIYTLSVHIIIKSLKIEFGKKIVFSDLSVTFKSGVSVILGSNGSGKTTLLRIISGLQKQTGGEIEFDGFQNSFHVDDSKNIFLCSPDISLYNELLVIENIKLISKLRNVEIPSLDGWNIDEYKNKKYGQLSSGYKQRVKAIISFMINPEVLLLDEPEQHMDERGIDKLTDEIEKRNSSGLMTIIATNNLWREWDVLVTL